MYSNSWPSLLGEYLADEFRIDLYCSKNGGGIGVRHVATGKVRHATFAELGTGSKRVAARNDMFTSLVAELKAEGIPPKPPEPPKLGVKKIGKPRWSKEATANE